MKKLFRNILIVAAAALLLLLGSCNKGKVGDISVEKYELKSVFPSSFRSLSCTLGLELKNNGPKIILTDIQGELYHGEEGIATFKADSLVIAGRTTSSVDVKGVLVAEKGKSLMNVMSILSKSTPKEFKLDVTATASLGRLKKKLKYENIPLNTLMK